MSSKLTEIASVVAHHAHRELLRGPLGVPLTARHRGLVQRLTYNTPASRRLWSALSAIDLSPWTRKTLFRLLYNLPFGPGDAAAPHRVVRRHRELIQRLQSVWSRTSSV